MKCLGGADLPGELAFSGASPTFTVDQQAYLQGYLPVQQMYLYKVSGGLVGPTDSDTSHAYVTKDNVGLYLGKSRFGGSTTAEPT
jgi:simple sugar transport system substrate-binding protein